MAAGLGLYVHLPFCPARCPYCDFFAKPFQAGEARRLLAGLSLHLDRLAPRARLASRGTPKSRLFGDPAQAAGRPLATVYFGGGTPSLLPAYALAGLLAAIRARLPLHPEAEVSLEANPGTLSLKKLQLLRQSGVNRLSLGAQTFQAGLLRSLSRLHSPADTRRAARQARAAGFANLSLDLIYGLPGQTLPLFRADLETALVCQPDHLSLYELTLAPETPFGRRYAKGRPPLSPEQDVLAMEDLAADMLPAAGLSRYEVSNYARPGMECRHNQDTWQGGDYLALGPGAHGHLAGRRWANLPDVHAYLEALEQGRDPAAFTENLAPAQRVLELFMLGLRTTRGVDLDQAAALLHADPRQTHAAPIRRLLDRGWASLQGRFLAPTPLGLRMADAAAAEFV